jgi:CRP/FNR family nitrogen fixation transcriptional regulator
VPVARNKQLFASGEPATFIYRVIHGAVRIAVDLPDGRRQVVAIYFPGDMFGIEPDGQHRMTAEAIVDSKVALTSLSVLEWSADRDRDLAEELAKLTAARLSQAHNHIVALGQMTATERVASFLLDLSRRLQCGDRIELVMGRTDIADYLGLTVETISRTLHDLEAQGLITLPGCRTVEIRDRAALEAMAAGGERTQSPANEAAA